MTTRSWTTPGDVAAKLKRRWADGSLLAALARDAPFPTLDLPIRGPRASEIGDDLGAVQDWVEDLERGSRGGERYRIIYGEIGGREFGRNRIPVRVLIESYEQAWSILRVKGEVERYCEILDHVARLGPVHDWVLDKPLKALNATQDWPSLLAAYEWLDAARGSNRFLRTIDVAGVDTKFVERHRSTLAGLLGVSGTASGFLADLGLASKPELIRLRFEPGFAGFPARLSEATLRVGELAELGVAVQSAVVVENETTFLSLDPPSEGVLLWGKGFEADRVGRIPWLSEVSVWYWGDLDTHGFAILDRLRARLPHARSFLMDRESLLEHRDRWVSEPSPASGRLTRLDEDESQLYGDLVGDRYGPAVRLEQERLDWGWVIDHLPYN